MAVSKVTLNGDTLMSITDTTATASRIFYPYGAYGKDGAWMSGTYAGGSATRYNITSTTNQDGTQTLSITDAVDGAYFVIFDIDSDGTQRLYITDASEGGGTPNLQSKTKSYTPTETAQSETVTADSGYDGLSSVSVSVGAISSSYVGSGISRRDSTSLSASGDTVSVPAGYYASSASKAVSSMTLPTSASGTSSGTSKATIGRSTSAQYINIPTGYNSSAAYYTVSAVENGTAGTPTATKGTVSNHSVSVTPSVTNTTGYITGGTKSGTAVTVSASELASGNKEITSNGTNIDVVGYSTVSVNVSGGGGGSGMQVGTKTATPSSAGATISFTGLSGEPTSFSVVSASDLATGASPYKVAAVVYDGTDVHAQTITNTNNAQVTYDGSSFSKSYSNGTLTITSTGAYFQANQYLLTYSYGGSASNVSTKDVQVGSGATSITFTNLEDEPSYFSCIFKSNFSTSSGYQRVIAVVYDGGDTYGLEMDSGAKYSDAHWSYTYNNGSLVISSSGTNAGGYFHQPGYYQLTYGIGEASPYQNKTVTPSSSQQIIEADEGYDALSRVTVQAIPSSYVQPTSTVGATTYRASTSNQTITSGTYHSAAATIAAVTQTNLTADNIKSGTTVTISNGQSNLWSVTGTYSGGGGGSANLDTETTTNSSNQNTSISFTITSGRTVKAFFCRLTSQIARNSNSRYYYVFDMRWDGSSSGGVAGNTFYMYSGTLTNVTSGYSYEQSGTTFTLSSTGSRSASPGSFYNGTYELVYVY